MNATFPAFFNRIALRGSATHPIEPPWRGLGALLVLAGVCLPRPLAYPAHPMTAHSGAFN